MNIEKTLKRLSKTLCCVKNTLKCKFPDDITISYGCTKECFTLTYDRSYSRRAWIHGLGDNILEDIGGASKDTLEEIKIALENSLTEDGFTDFSVTVTGDVDNLVTVKMCFNPGDFSSSLGDDPHWYIKQTAEGFDDIDTIFEFLDNEPCTINTISICVGQEVCITATVTGGGINTYHWEHFYETWYTIPDDDDNSNIFILCYPYNVEGDYIQRFVVTQCNGNIIYGDPVTVSVGTPPEASIHSDTACSAICIGDSVVFSITSDPVEIQSYQWQINFGEGFSDIPGETNETYILVGTEVIACLVQVVITYTNGCITITNSIEVDINIPTVSVVSNSDTFEMCYGNGINLSIVSNNECAGEPLNQWQMFIDDVWTDIEGQIYDTLNVGLLGLSPGDYPTRVIYNIGTNCEVTSDGVDVIICDNSDLQVFDNADDNEICDGGVGYLNSDVVGCSCGTLSYQWQIFNDPDWIDIEGATSANYETPALINTNDPDPTIYTYRLKAVCGGCTGYSTDTTGGQQIYVNPDPQVFISVDDDEFCNGGWTTLHSETIGGAGGNNFQWQQFIDDVWVDITLANGENYSTDPLSTGTYFYRFIVTQDSGCYAISDSITVTVVDDCNVTISVDIDTIGPGDISTLSSNVVGGAGSNNFQWQMYSNYYVSWVDIFGENSDTLSIVYDTWIGDGSNPDVLGAVLFRVIVEQDAGCECFSNELTITIT